ncbi:MAG: amidohydrolase family protein [Anaerolineales bacterium]
MGTSTLTTAIKAGRLLDGNGGPPLLDAVLLVDEGRITTVGPAAEVTLPPSATVVDASSMTVLPGLIDCHCHPSLYTIDMTARLYAPQTVVLFKTAQMLRRILHAGFTTVREAGALNDVGFKRAVDLGLLESPRMLIAIALDQTGGHFEEVYPWQGVEIPFMGATIVDGVPDVTKAARKALRGGADFIKIAATGGVVSPNDSPEYTAFTPAELDAIVYEAHARDREVIAHAEGTQGIKNAVRAGVWDIQHASFLDEEGADLMAARGTYLTPTLSVIEILNERGAEIGLPPVALDKLARVRERHFRSFEMALAAGLKITCGTDIISEADHGDNARELELMVAHGMTPMQAIVAATRTSAEACRVADSIGTLEAGKQADLLVVDGNPLDDIALLRDPARIGLVMKGGETILDKLPDSSCVET